LDQADFSTASGVVVVLAAERVAVGIAALAL